MGKECNMKKQRYKPKPVDENKILIALYNAERKYNIIKRAAMGETYEVIAREYDITRQRVESIIKRNYVSSDTIKGC
jgi:predicted nucleic acid-binding protein